MTGSPPSSTQMDFDILCRQCATYFTAPAGSSILPKRCPACRSPRLLHHEELTKLDIVHLDCDAFFAAIEIRDNPSLADKPVIIGGGKRGVVSTACYNARIFGIHSAMPMFKAKKLCPHAVIIKPNGAKYSEASKQIRRLMHDFTPLVEPLSIDEAFLDLRGTQKLHKMFPAQSITKLALKIEQEVGITVSIGLSYNKFLAKLASDMDKPRGFSIIGRAETIEKLAALPIKRIWGVGKAMQKKLHAHGITHVRHLQMMSEIELIRRYGTIGYRLARLSRGDDSRIVSPGSERKSISTETTFSTDIDDRAQLEKHLWRLCEKLSTQCKTKNIAGKTVTLKLKTYKFQSVTRQRALYEPTQMAEEIYKAGKLLLHEYCNKKAQSYRLLGIGLSALTTAEFADLGDLADPDKRRRIATERAMDKVRDKFGTQIVKKGRSLL